MMPGKMKRIGRYLTYAVFSNAVYGLILYFLVTWLARFSPLYAYIGNLAMVALGLVADILILKTFTSPKYISQMKQLKEAEKEYRILQWTFDNYISFKAMLHLFYAILLMASQIINFSNIAVGENLDNFMRTTDYSIVLIIAFDSFSEQFSHGRKDAEIALKKLRKNWNDRQE